MAKTKERIQNRYLKSYKAQSEKFLDAPLSRKPIALVVEKPVHDILETMGSTDRISFIRRAIGEALVREGLLDLPDTKEVQSNGNSN